MTMPQTKGPAVGLDRERFAHYVLAVTAAKLIDGDRDSPGRVLPDEDFPRQLATWLSGKPAEFADFALRAGLEGAKVYTDSRWWATFDRGTRFMRTLGPPTSELGPSFIDKIETIAARMLSGVPHEANDEMRSLARQILAAKEDGVSIEQWAAQLAASVHSKE